MVKLSSCKTTGRFIVEAGRLKFTLLKGSGLMAMSICDGIPEGTRNRRKEIQKRFAEWGIIVKQ